MKGYIYIRTNEWCELKNVCKLGITKSIKNRNTTYITGEITRGYFIKIFEIDIIDNELKYIDNIIKLHFKNLNIYTDGGTEFYNKTIIDKIDDILIKNNINFTLVNEDELNKINKKNDENKIIKNQVENKKIIQISNRNTNQKYTCVKCNKQYKTENSYKQHIEKCKGINILTCPKCMNNFASRFSKSAHIKKNNCKAKSIINLDNEYINGNNIINNYGNERTDYITFDDMIRILNTENNMIVKYIEFKHFNKDFPENHNIKYNIHLGYIIKKENEWSIIDIDDLADNLFKNNSLELQQYYNKQKVEIENKIKNIELIDLCLNKDVLSKIKNKIRSLSIYT